MASAAVIIGRDLTLRDFWAIYNNQRIRRSPFLFYMPVETAHPICLENPGKWTHVEGVLATITSDEIKESELESNLKKWLVETAKQIERDYCDSHQNGREWARKKGIDYDFPVPHGKIGSEESGDVLFKPYYQILMLWPGEIDFNAYRAKALPLVNLTKDARIKRYSKIQGTALVDAISSLAEKNPKPILV